MEEELPESFSNKVVEINGACTTIRSNVRTMEEIKKWVYEYGQVTNTKWNARSSKPEGQRIVCLKKYVCHHSSFCKIPSEKNKRSISKNSSCPATISLKVKLETAQTKRNDSMVQQGLPCIIIINGNHNHSLNTEEALRFLPPAVEIKSGFLEQFEAGLGTAEARRRYEESLRSKESFSELEMANHRIMPSYRTVQYWYDQWRERQVEPRTGLRPRRTRRKSKAAAAATSAEKPPDPTLEPEIVIKEEPIDVDEPDINQPSTSQTEFILPIPSTPDPHTPSLGVAYSVADLKKENSTSPLSNGGKPSPTAANDKRTSARNKKRKTDGDVADEKVSTSDSAPDLNSVKDRPKDQFDAYGEYIAAKLRKLDWKSCAYVQKAIGDIMFEAEMGKYKEKSP